jgi:hypothetical protein
MISYLSCTPLMLCASSFRIYRYDFLSVSERGARGRARAREFDFETKAQLIATRGPRMNPYKTFEIMCKLKDGEEVIEEKVMTRRLSFLEKKRGESEEYVVRKKLHYEEEKRHAYSNLGPLINDMGLKFMYDVHRLGDSNSMCNTTYFCILKLISI